LGVSQYRLGHSQQALETLIRARKLNTGRFFGSLSSSDLAILAEIVTHLRNEAMVSEAVRQQALGLVEHYAAFEVVECLFDKEFLRTVVLEKIRADATLSEPVRREALVLAEQHPENANLCNQASWFLVRKPGVDAGAYLRALTLAEAACRLTPDNGNNLNTLGVAQYRMGHYQ